MFRPRVTALVVIVFLLSACTGLRHEHPPAAAVASAHPLATAAGVEMLATGGNAFDAAVAVAAALAVVEPYGSGLGGGGFWLLHRAADARQVMLDARERAPLAAHRDMYLDASGDVVSRRSIDGALAAGIPGVPKALEHLARHYGRLPLRVSLAPAIRYAREGFAVDARFRRYASFRLQALRASAPAARVFLHENDIPPIGHVVRQLDLARTLEAMAEQGAAAFYAGPVAHRLVEGVREAGGIWTLADLAQYEVVEREPIVGRYGDTRVVSAAPPSSGGVAIVTMLNILAAYNRAFPDRVGRSHLVIEAMRRAYRDRAEFLGDPDFVDVPVARLVSPEHAAALGADIEPDAATPSELLAPSAPGALGGASTTHFSILDRAGNRVAATLSVNYPFGSGVMPPGTGVLLNDEMDDFSVKPGVPNVYGLIGAEANAVAPGKRPLSSMSPTFLENGQRVAILGTPGGSRIITMVLLAALEFIGGADAQAMVDHPRFHHQYLPDVVHYEPEIFTDADIEHLERLGHELHPVRDRYGNMHTIVWDRQRGSVQAASDPRAGGAAAVW